MKARHWLLIGGIAAGVSLGVSGCASPISHHAARFSPADGRPLAPIVVGAEIDVAPAGGFSNVIKAGSVWTHVGRVPQGSVYKIKDDVFTIEGANRHEAYAVVVDGKLIGFYLPVEQGFVAAARATPLGTTASTR